MQDTNELFIDQPDFVFNSEEETAQLFDEKKPEEAEKSEADETATIAVKPEDKDPTSAISEQQKLEMLSIFDALLFEGMYEERVKIGKNYHAVFRTRSAADDLAISSRLDAMKFETILAYQNQSSLLTLAYSLVEWNGQDYRDVKPKDRYDLISKLPSQAVVIISSALGVFDAKVMSAVQYGRENF